MQSPGGRALARARGPGQRQRRCLQRLPADLIVLPAGGEKPSLDWEIPIPIWVVEFLSPSTAQYDRDVKLPRLAGKGVQEAWLIDPWAPEIAVYRLRDGTVQRCGAGETARSLTVPGFQVALADYF